jgi:hypothetical protein
MKDQKVILIKCIKNEEPAFVIAGHDAFAVEAMQAYLNIASQNGAKEDFLEDLQLVIDDMKLFQKQEADQVKIPSLKYNEINKLIHHKVN